MAGGPRLPDQPGQWFEPGVPGGPAGFPAGPGAGDDVRGEAEITVDGVTYVRGGKLRLTPGTDRDVYDRMLDGRAATIERIYLDYDDRIYFGVTVDDDPGQQLMRESGRYLFFFAHEVAPL